MAFTSSSAPTAPSGPGTFAKWLASIGFMLLLGTGALAARLIWEQTVWSWERGPQMVGFSLVHGDGVILLLFPVLVVCWLPISIIHLLYQGWTKRSVSRACLVVTGLAVILLGAMSLPYGFWQRLFVDKLTKGPYVGEFFVHAAAVGDIATVETFVAHGVAPNIRDRSGKTALHGAAVQGQMNVIQYLISAGADVNAVDGIGSSPLQNATSEHREEAAKLLADHGAVIIHGSEERSRQFIDERVREDLEWMRRHLGPNPTERSGASR